MNLQGDYKLFRQGGGRAAFAHVYVQVIVRDAADQQFVVATDPDDSSTVTPDQESELFNSAIQGCREGLHALQIKGLEVDNYQVIVTRLLINRVDTRPGAVRASAFLATVTAFGIQDQFQVVFSENEWKVIKKA